MVEEPIVVANVPAVVVVVVYCGCGACYCVTVVIAGDAVLAACVLTGNLRRARRLSLQHRVAVLFKSDLTVLMSVADGSLLFLEMMTANLLLS